MWLKHLLFCFETDAKVPPLFVWRPSDIDGKDWRTIFGEVQFAATALTVVGADRNGFPGAERVAGFPLALRDRWNRRAVAPNMPNPNEPATLERLAEVIHGEACEYVKLYPLVAVHAVRLSRFEDMSDAVTFISCAVPLQVVHGQVTYKPRPAASSAKRESGVA
jgi:hypothetical protein